MSQQMFTRVSNKAAVLLRKSQDRRTLRTLTQSLMAP